MCIIIPEDYQNAVRALDCFRLLDGHQVDIFSDSVSDVNVLAERFAEADALMLIRERTKITEDLLARLPRLKLISQTGKIAGHLDLAACNRHSVAVAEGQGSAIAPAELTWALIINAWRQLLPAFEAMKSGQWQVNIGRALNGHTLGIWGYGKIGGGWRIMPEPLICRCWCGVAQRRGRQRKRMVWTLLLTTWIFFKGRMW